MDSEAVRAAALLAAAIARNPVSPEDLVSYAGQLVPWIAALPSARLDATLALDGAVIAHSSNGGDMAFTAVPGVNTRFDVLVLPRDASDNITGDVIAFATDDPAGAILAGSVSADGRTWTGLLTGATGTVNLTASCPAAPAVPAFSAQLTVAAGPVTHLDGTVTVT